MSAPRRSHTSVAVVGVAVLALAGCGADGGDRASGAEGTPAVWEATLGGQPVELEDDRGRCRPTDSGVELIIGDIDPDAPSRGTGIHAVIALPADDGGGGSDDGGSDGGSTADGGSDGGSGAEEEPDGPELRIVRFALADGTRLLHTPASRSGPGLPSTTVEVEGDRYRIDGAGTVNDTSGGARTAAFTLEVTCG